MPDARDRLDSLASLDRRSVLAAAGSAAAGGGVLLSVGAEPAAADVTMGEPDITGGSFTAETLDPIADVRVKYDYDVGSADVAALRTELLAGGDVIATERLTTDTTALENDTTLSGRVTDAEAYAAADFAPAVGESVTVDVEVGVTFAVLDSADAVLASDSVSDTVPVTVAHPQESAYEVTIGVEGEIRTAAE